jgi:2-methylisocitrate lyase-like PEP mutase family enzyme
LATAPAVYDGITAQLVRRMGFSAAYMTGAGMAASAHGLAALDARDHALIVARTDAWAVLGLDAAIERANAYEQAGSARRGQPCSRRRRSTLATMIATSPV